MEKKTLHVISNSHWDREWGYPYEETRMLLLDFMDELLDLLDNDEKFPAFTFDSQTLGIEDYLEMRPENTERLKKHVKSGRLIVGPWYSLPEEYLVSGESLVRNLVVGHKSANKLGKVSKIGYTPFGYGQTSQMPQIYHGFGIDTIVFYRGINTPNSEFLWEGVDGSQLLGMRFGCMSRFSYYFYIYRQVRYGMDNEKHEYDWDRGASPFRMASADRNDEHYYVLDSNKKSWNTDIIPKQIKKLIEDESEHFTTSHIACMQGFDTSNPDPKESELIELCQEALPEHTIKLSTLADYFEGMRKEVKNPTKLFGESRDPGSVGKYTHLFGDVISARTRLKRANHKAEILLQRNAEPWSAIGSMVGGSYMRTSLDRCWQLLLKNHPHDTITGAGIDQMEKDSLYRADQINIISNGVSRRGMQNIQIQIDNSDLTEKDAVLTIFNPTPFARKEILSVYIDMPNNMDYDGFSICTPEGEVKDIQIKNQYNWGTLVRNLQDISLELKSERVHCTFETDAIPAFGYKTYHIIKEDKNKWSQDNIVNGTNVLENDYLKVQFNENGTLNMTHKETGHTYSNIHYLEDTGDIGHSWVHKKPNTNRTITSHGFPCTISVEEQGHLKASIKIDYFMQIPIGVDDKMKANDRFEMKPDTKRSEITRELKVSSLFTLTKDAKRLDVKTTLVNDCENHRLRVVFPTNLDTDSTNAEVSFDVVARDIHVKKDNAYYGKDNPTYPMYRFVDMDDKKNGFAILNTGIREYEAMDLPDRPLAITLFRAFTYRNPPVIDRWEVYPEMELAQCPGKHEWTYAIYPHSGDWKNGVYQEAEKLNLPLETAQVGAHEGHLPKELSFLEILGDNIQMTAFKQTENKNGNYIVRLFNPTEDSVKTSLKFASDIKNAYLTNMNEEREETLSAKSNILTFDMAKKKIVTIEIELEAL